MPIDAAKLIVEIAADTSKLTKGLKGANTDLNSFATGAVKVGAGLTAAITGPAVLAAGAVVKVAMAAEQSQIAFTTMLGSGEKAARFLEDLRDFAASTPFEFTELQSAARRMLAFGFAAEDVLPMMTDIGDAVSGLGLGAEGVDRVTLALGQMQAKSKVSGGEMMQLTEAGIPAWRYLSEAMGLTTAEVMKLSEKGLLPAGEAIDNILSGMRQDFGGMMAAQSLTAAGQLSNLQDELTNVATELGTILLPAVKDVTGALKTSVEWFGNMGESGQKSMLMIVGAAAAIGPVTTIIGGLTKAVIGLSAGLGVAGTALTAYNSGLSLATALGVAGFSPAVAGMIAAVTPLIPIIVAAAGAIAGLTWAWDKFITQNNASGAKNVQNSWTQFFDKQVRSGNSAADVMKEYRKAQDGVNQALENAGVVRLFIANQDELVSNTDGLNQALARSAESYREYLNVASGARAEGLVPFTEAEWQAAQAADYYNMSAMQVINQMPEYTEAMAAGAEGTAAMTQSAEDAAKAQEAVYAEMAKGAQSTKNSLGEMVGQYDSLQAKMDSWLKDTAGQVVSMLGDKFSEASGKYRAALLEVDTVLGTNYTQQLLQKDAVQGLVDEYAKTGNLDAFKEGLIKIKDEGLADMKTQLEEVTTKAGFLYDKLMALPENIRIRIDFDVEALPSWVPGNEGYTPSTPPWQGGGTEEDWATGVTNFVVPPGYPNDSFHVGLSSGEVVNVDPAGSRGGRSLQIGEINIYSAASNGRELFEEFKNELDAYIRNQRTAGAQYAGVNS